MLRNENAGIRLCKAAVMVPADGKSLPEMKENLLACSPLALFTVSSFPAKLPRIGVYCSLCTVTAASRLTDSATGSATRTTSRFIDFCVEQITLIVVRCPVQLLSPPLLPLCPVHLRARPR